MSAEKKNWAEARKTAASLENFFSHLGNAKQVFEDVLRAEKEYAAVLRLIAEAEKNAVASRERAEQAELDAMTVADTAAKEIEASEASVEVAQKAALEKQSANQKELDAENAEEVRGVSATVRELKEHVTVQTENRDNLVKEIEHLTETRDSLNEDLDKLRERIG